MLVLFNFSFCGDIQVDCTSTAGDVGDDEWNDDRDNDWNGDGDDDVDGDGGADDDWDGDGDNGCILIVTIYIVQL